MIRYLTPEQMAKAHLLWSQKKWDTLMIAEHLKVPEHVVFNSLRERRERHRVMSEATKRLAANL
jgi:hypothetical protein